ncbi:MAG: hypothetical protein ING59_16635 [Burkholderiales bacterium]|nr:hypothetical protein [Burkholderiales bacterium]
MRRLYSRFGPLGEAIVQAVECQLDAIRETAPRLDDYRHSLRALAQGSLPRDRRLLAEVDLYLLPVARQRYGVHSTAALTDERVIDCAAEALQRIPRSEGGKPATVWLRQRLLRQLLELVPAWSRRDQDLLMMRVLRECGLAAADEYLLLDRLRRRAGADFLAADAREARRQELLVSLRKRYLTPARKMSLDEAHRL